MTETEMKEKMITRFTDDELKQVKTLRANLEKKVVEFGDIKISRINIEQQIKQLDEYESKIVAEFLALKKEEQELSASLNKKYGNGTLNIESGEFTVEI